MLPIIALGVFAVAALFGAFMAIRHFTGSSLPMPAALLHGLFAASGLGLLIVAYLTTGLPSLANVALALFLIAALGGFFLFSFHLRKKSLPSPVVVIHAGAAVTAFVLLGLSIL